MKIIIAISILIYIGFAIFYEGQLFPVFMTILAINGLLALCFFRDREEFNYCNCDICVPTKLTKTVGGEIK